MKASIKPRDMFAGLILAVAVSAGAAADNFYFRSKGMASGPSGNADPQAGLSVAETRFRMGSALSGVLTTNLDNASWTFTQSPAFPSLGLQGAAGNLTGQAPAVSTPTTFTISAQAAAGKRNAATNTASFTVHPLPEIAGGPNGPITGFTGQQLPDYPAYSLFDVLGTSSYDLLSGGSVTEIGSLCAGLAFSRTSGKISGVPTAPCSASLSVRVTDSFDGAARTSGTSIVISAPFAMSANGVPSNKAAENDAPYSDQSITVSGGSGSYTRVDILNQGDLGFSASISGNTVTLSGKKNIGFTLTKAYEGIRLRVTDSANATVTGDEFAVAVTTMKPAVQQAATSCKKGTGTIGSANTTVPCTNAVSVQLNNGDYVEYSFDRPVVVDRYVGCFGAQVFSGARYDHSYHDGSGWQSMGTNTLQPAQELSGKIVAQRFAFKMRAGGGVKCNTYSAY
jgi:hypothetical protein